MVNEPPGTAHPAEPATPPAVTESAERDPLEVVAPDRCWVVGDPAAAASPVCWDLTNQVRPAAAAIATTTATITPVRPVRDR